jgi:hypothetical protein
MRYRRWGSSAIASCAIASCATGHFSDVSDVSDASSDHSDSEAASDAISDHSDSATDTSSDSARHLAMIVTSLFHQTAAFWLDEE